jgi:hypothetical protein
VLCRRPPSAATRRRPRRVIRGCSGLRNPPCFPLMQPGPQCSPATKQDPMRKVQRSRMEFTPPVPNGQGKPSCMLSLMQRLTSSCLRVNFILRNG